MRDKYRLKVDKKAYLYPHQWVEFYKLLKEKQQPYFKISINTGGRYNEIKHLQVQHIDFNRCELTFFITKIKAKKKETRPEPRTIKISTELSSWLKRWVRKYKLKPTDTFNIPSKVAVSKALKTKLKKLGLDNWADFSSHNIRKSHGNWLKGIAIDGFEICSRLGHDFNTFLKSYSSSSLFNDEDKKLIREILGDLYEK